MARASRAGDRTRGHKDHGPRVIRARGSVLINSRPAAKVGDKAQPSPHPSSGHPGRIIRGARRVRVRGKGLVRKGDRVACGEKVNKGSSNVRA